MLSYRQLQMQRARLTLLFVCLAPPLLGLLLQLGKVVGTPSKHGSDSCPSSPNLLHRLWPFGANSLILAHRRTSCLLEEQGLKSP